MEKLPSCSLVTPTYNWPEALELLLFSAMNQTVLPNEVLIADDGSREDTKQLIEHFQKRFPVPLIHIWHEDIKNRKPKIMNAAIAAAKYDYIIEIDGDIIMNRHFVEDHLTFADKGLYLFGSRVNIQKQILPDLFSRKIIHFNFFSKGIKKRGRTLRFPFLMKFAKIVDKRSSKLRGCNMSFWRSDFIKINGFNESLVGWGIDDSEMIQRLHNLGIKGKRLKNAGIAYHIYHKEQSKSHIEINNEIERETTEKKLTFIEKGINQYL
ncbi:glycosyltransferase family 2 protein [Flavobacterium sp. GT3R68]|uniref:glycosyltransferase family 2 protein n=1 Tax=Flavobacterium sp. GT3R68 TaxID=2594437 RepID=UPI000F8623E6|nr:glycosyltransferase family 2 protein [Flavobacterium sp. GT3R68]RTY92390.1 glycosyltransferase [Flavobacterium sp. GSN2]TRW92306.1 glycosyltransferase [Flavobacterium sp. GT3R68]